MKMYQCLLKFQLCSQAQAENPGLLPVHEEGGDQSFTRQVMTSFVETIKVYKGVFKSCFLNQIIYLNFPCVHPLLPSLHFETRSFFHMANLVISRLLLVNHEGTSLSQ